MKEVDPQQQLRESIKVPAQIDFVKRALKIKLALDAAKKTQNTAGLSDDVTSSLENILKDASKLEGDLLLEFDDKLENTSGDDSDLLTNLLILNLEVVEHSVEAAALVNPINIDIEKKFPNSVNRGELDWIKIPKVGSLKCEIQYSDKNFFRLLLDFDPNVVVQNVVNDHNGSPSLKRVKQDGVECILRATYNSTTILVFNGVRHSVKITDLSGSSSKTLSIKAEDN
jgi:hypothetical protein